MSQEMLLLLGRHRCMKNSAHATALSPCAFPNGCWLASHTRVPLLAQSLVTLGRFELLLSRAARQSKTSTEL